MIIVYEKGGPRSAQDLVGRIVFRDGGRRWRSAFWPARVVSHEGRKLKAEPVALGFIREHGGTRYGAPPAMPGGLEIRPMAGVVASCDTIHEAFDVCTLLIASDEAMDAARRRFEEQLLEMGRSNSCPLIEEHRERRRALRLAASLIAPLVAERAL